MVHVVLCTSSSLIGQAGASFKQQDSCSFCRPSLTWPKVLFICNSNKTSCHATTQPVYPQSYRPTHFAKTGSQKPSEPVAHARARLVRLLGRALGALLQRLGVGALLRAVGLESLLTVGGELGLPVAGSLLLLGEGVLLVLLIVDVGLCVVSSVNRKAEIGPGAFRQQEGASLRCFTYG